MNSQELEHMICQGLPGAQVNVHTEDQVHYQASVRAQQFNGLSKVQQHRLVYQALGDAMVHRIHALALDTQPLENDK
jgi:stress-induced morphogen